MTLLGLKYIEPNFLNIFIRSEVMFVKLTIFLFIYLLVDFYITVHNLLKINHMSKI